MKRTFEQSAVIDKGLRVSAYVLAIGAAVSIVSILVVIVTSVILRKFFDTPLFFTEELVGLLMSASLFLALPMVTLYGDHIRVSLLVDFIRGRDESAFEILVVGAMLVGSIFTIWILLEAVPWLEFAFRHQIKTETARILLYPLMSVVPLSMTLCCSIFLARLLGFIRIKER